ncbi:hypothetical protein [Mycobacterium celatum]|uniref:hypothetical protein n=1 Tax=Mycobacterium celatum TaxID=28045 RepID=UPI00146F7978|nr:hypothetical protein [Mycobacterium celatum]
MWLSFRVDDLAALQVGIGKLCAITGNPWSEHLSRNPQNYLALPEQPWLDGIRPSPEAWCKSSLDRVTLRLAV